MKRPLLLLFVFLQILFSVGCKAQSGAMAAGHNFAPVPATVDRVQLLQLVNEVRRKGCRCGAAKMEPAPPLAWNDQLEAAAYHHVTDMAKHQFFSHQAPDGSRGGERLIRAGYRWKTFGENIGEGYKTEKEMLEGWLKSPGHCKNIMNQTFTEIGVARAGNLWTQELGSR